MNGTVLMGIGSAVINLVVYVNKKSTVNLACALASLVLACLCFN